MQGLQRDLAASSSSASSAAKCEGKLNRVAEEAEVRGDGRGGEEVSGEGRGNGEGIRG